MPVAKLTTFHYLISMAASHGLAIDHVDAVTAFLNPEVNDTELLDGFMVTRTRYCQTLLSDGSVEASDLGSGIGYCIYAQAVAMVRGARKW